MIPKEILKKVRRIEIKTKGLVKDLFGGQYHSAFKGQGMTFSEVREYVPGDDIRLIDWNVTARSNQPFVKLFEEERELSVFLMVDVSRSGHFGTEIKFKSEIAAEIAAVLGFSAINNQDKVGLILFSDHVEKFISPKKGRLHILRVVREILYHQPEGTGTSLSEALDFLIKIARRKAVVFLISDFLDNNFWKSLKLANKKHDLIGIRISDPAEEIPPSLGLIKVHDPETDETFWMDNSSPGLRDKHIKLIKNHWTQFKKNCDRIKFDLISIRIDLDYIDPLMTFFRRRRKRY